MTSPPQRIIEVRRYGYNFYAIIIMGKPQARQGVFDIKEAYSLDDIRSGHYKLLKVKDVLNIDKVTVSLELKAKILNGNKFKGNYSDRVLCLDENGEELAIYKRDNDDMRVEVMLK